MLDLDRIKDANPIEDVIAEAGHAIRGSRKFRRSDQHNSLVINVDDQSFFWNSRGLRGDVITWLTDVQNMTFKQAVQHLASRANIPLQMSENEARAWKASRAKSDVLTTAASFLAEVLQASPAAMAWATGRGFTEETIKAAGCGFWDGNRKALTGRFQLHGIDLSSEATQAVMKIPPGMFIYAHWVGGRCGYLTARSIEGKQHYNLVSQLVGPRQPYFNHEYGPKSDHLVIVEGQADALTLAQWGLPAVALAGCQATDPHLVALLKGHRHLYVGLDHDQAGAANVASLAGALGAQTRIVTWPEHDANDWLQAGATSENCRELLASGPIYAEWLADQVSQADPLDQEAARGETYQVISQLPAPVYAERRKELAASLGQNVTTLDRVIRELQKARKQQDRRGKVERKIGGYIQGHLFETVLDESDPAQPVTKFAIRNPAGEISVRPYLEFDGLTIEPIPADSPEIASKTILLAPPPMPYTSEADLVSLVKNFLHQYIDLTSEFETISAYYAIYSWIYDIPTLEKVPYLRRVGDYGGGKSRWLTSMWAVCFRSFYGVNPSSAALFRLAHQFQGTLCLDEFDLPNVITERAKDMLDVINGGYSRNVSVSRVAPRPDNTYAVESFKIYGPKIFAMRRQWGDDAADSRCLTDTVAAGGFMDRQDIPIAINQVDFWREVAPIRAQLLYYRLQTWRDYIEIPEENQNHAHLPGRLREIILPLQMLFDSEQLQDDLDRLVSSSYKQTLAQRAQTLPSKILQGILQAWHKPGEEAAKGPQHLRLALKYVTQATNEIIDAENEESKQEQTTEGATEGQQARPKRKRQLTPQGIAPKIRDDLGLVTENDEQARLVYVVWQLPKIEALCKRFGLENILEGLLSAEKPPKDG